MKRKGPILAVILFLLITLLPLALRHRRVQERQAKRLAAEMIGHYVLEGIADGRFFPGETYYFSQLDPQAEVVQTALAQPSFQYVYPVEEDVVLIMGEPLFQSVSGYLVTTGEQELPSQYETGVKGLDAGGRVSTTKINDHLYSWAGGL